MELQGKTDFDRAMQRIDAWFAHDMLDRPPVRFAEHNADFAGTHLLAGRTWPDLRTRWFDAEFQVDYFIESIRGRTFHGETFPVFWPNLGPNVYAAFHGAELDFGEVTSWVRHCVHEPADMGNLKFSRDNVYFRKIGELTRVALQQCTGRFMVGYTDLHGSLDCAADWRNPQQLCLDLADDPALVHQLVNLANENFRPVFDHYDAVLKAHGQMSVTWMGIPARGKMHVSSCDFTNMVSPQVFDEFYLPTLLAEVQHMTHNVFHLDGKGMLRHLDRILAIPEIQAIQWVHGVGEDAPILQWLPVIRKIQAAGKGVIVDLQLHELEPFIAAMKPDGLYLCLAAPEATQPDILKRLQRWGRGMIR
ncbi:MAG: hypothetical protein NTW21_26800 [Verrucomicrobia bacterium]|nr:hypothetical protein [Verrucomicrobiota bacterium]